jgi:hypothetical protein
VLFPDIGTLPHIQRPIRCLYVFFWLYSPLWTLASLMILPQIFLTSAFFRHASTYNNFTTFKTLSSHLNLGPPFIREPSGWDKLTVLQGEFSSILTKCPAHLILATLKYYFDYIWIFIQVVKFIIVSNSPDTIRQLYAMLLSCHLMI